MIIVLPSAVAPFAAIRLVQAQEMAVEAIAARRNVRKRLLFIAIFNWF